MVFPEFAWQRNYYEHIIRSKESLNRISVSTSSITHSDGLTTGRIRRRQHWNRRMHGHVTESVVDEAALAWLKTGGGRVTHGPDIAPDLPPAGRADHDGRPDARSGQHELTNSRAAN
jgi:hypothetical protein